MAKRPEPYLPGHGPFRCADCDITKPESEFRKRAGRKQMRRSCVDCSNLYSKRWKKNRDTARSKLSSHKSNASYRGIKSEIGLGDMRELLKIAVCGCCGGELSIEPDDSLKRHAWTLDRIDSERGYVKGNVAVICKDCNRAKGARTADELQMLADFTRLAEPDF